MLIFVAVIIDENKIGYTTFLQYKTGGHEIHSNPGYYINWLGNSVEWKNQMTVSFQMPTAQEQNTNNDKFSLELPMITTSFSDSIPAAIPISVRIEIPRDEKTFHEFVMAFRDPDNFLNSSLVTLVKDVVTGTSKMYAASDMLSTAKSELIRHIRNQLQNGPYIFEEYVVGKNEEENTVDTSAKRNIKYRIKIKDGKPVLSEEGSIFKKYKINIVHLSMGEIVFDKEYMQRLENERKLVAQQRETVEQARLEEENYLLEEKKGARARLEEENRLKIEELRKTMAAQAKEEESRVHLRTRKMEAEQALQIAELEASALKVSSEAQALAAQRKMEADNGFELRMKTLKDINEQWANALKGTPLVPNIMIGSGENSTRADQVAELLMLQLSQQAGVNLNAVNK